MVCKCHDYEDNVLSTDKVLELIEEAVVNKKALSLTRFSHAEITYLNWKYQKKLVKKMDMFKKYNGVDEPIEKITDILIDSLKNTTITGLIPEAYAEITTAPRDKNNGFYWYKLTKAFLHRENLLPNLICSVWSTQEMIYKNKFWEMLRGRSIAIVGRRADEAVPYFQNNGVNVSETIVLEGINNVKEVKDYLTNKEWDIAIVSAGIPATILTPQLSKETGRVVIDFGHALDRIIDGEKFDFHHLVDDLDKKKK